MFLVWEYASSTIKTFIYFAHGIKFYKQIILGIDSEIWTSIYTQRYLFISIYYSDNWKLSKNPTTRKCCFNGSYGKLICNHSKKIFRNFR